MSKTSLSKALDPIEFRFTDPDDIKKYGSRWYTYDEASILRLPGRMLLELETELGEPLPGILNGFRRNSVMGDLAVTWITVRQYSPKAAGEFDEYSPITMAIEWRKPEVSEAVAKEEPGKDKTADTSSEPMTSETTDTVVLQNLPIAESAIS